VFDLCAAAFDIGSAVSALFPLIGSFRSIAYSLWLAKYNLGSDKHHFFGLNSNNINSNLQQQETRNQKPVANNQPPATTIKKAGSKQV
jgi:hypothetical protein